MARIQTGSVDGFRLELASETIPQHGVLTDLDSPTRERVRDILNRALADIVRLIESRSAANTPAAAEPVGAGH